MIEFDVIPGGWPIPKQYPLDDFRAVIAGFLSCELGASLTIIDAYLTRIENVHAGNLSVWRAAGNCFVIEAESQGCHIRQYDPDPAPWALGEIDLSHEQLLTVIRAWKDHVQACIAAGLPNVGA